MSTFTDFFNIGRSLGLEEQDVWDNFTTAQPCDGKRESAAR